MNCKRCNKEFESNYSRKVFCSPHCRFRFNNLTGYLRRRNDQEFKKKNLERSKEWYRNNKQRATAYRKEYVKRREPDPLIKRDVICKGCGVEFVAVGLRKKVFCNVPCSVKFFNKSHNDRLKTDPVLKEKHRERNRKYYHRNKQEIKYRRAMKDA